MSAANLRTIWSATSPGMREHAADLRACRIYLPASAAWVALGELTELEAECLAAALSTPRWQVTHYAAPGVKTSLFVSLTEASDFARGKTLRGRPAAVTPYAANLKVAS